VLLHLAHRLQRLQHLRAHVDRLRGHRGRPPRGRRRPAGARCGRGRWVLVTRGHCFRTFAD
jgi:hypothetical protein